MSQSSEEFHIMDEKSRPSRPSYGGILPKSNLLMFQGVTSLR